ncbi:hypothetical protein DN536_35050, partial [Burkholderia multivorans]
CDALAAKLAYANTSFTSVTTAAAGVAALRCVGADVTESSPPHAASSAADSGAAHSSLRLIMLSSRARRIRTDA